MKCHTWAMEPKDVHVHRCENIHGSKTHLQIIPQPLGAFSPLAEIIWKSLKPKRNRSHKGQTAPFQGLFHAKIMPAFIKCTS